MAVITTGPSLIVVSPPPLPHSSNRARLCFARRRGNFVGRTELNCEPFGSRIKNSQDGNAESFRPTKSEHSPEDENMASDISFEKLKNKTTSNGISFLSQVGFLLGVAAVITLISVGVRQPNVRTSTRIQYLIDGPSASALAEPSGSFSFRAFGYRIILPEYAPGWIYFWLLMAAGCGLFISEEALNIWVI